MVSSASVLRLSRQVFSWPVFFRVWPVFEMDDQLAGFGQGDWIFGMQNEETLVCLGGLDVAVFALGGLNDAKVDFERGIVLCSEQDTDLILLPQGRESLAPAANRR